MVNYTVDQTTKTVRCIINISKGNVKGTYVGKAVCSIHDPFNVDKGQKIAFKRALLKLKRAEVRYHTSQAKWAKEWANVYSKSLKAIDHNNRRIQELIEEIDDLSV